jgi:ribosomal protein S18 acetylase RimI-like enzyme
MTRWVVRPCAEGEFDAVERIDTSFSTDTVLAIVRTADGYEISPKPVEPAVTKKLPFDDIDAARSTWATADVAVLDEGTVFAFAATRYHAWNSRLEITDLCVSPQHRRNGVGRASSIASS